MGEYKQYKIIWSSSFFKELDKICRYVATELKEPKISKKIYRSIVEKINSLKIFPERYIKFQIKDIEFRKISFKNFIIIYQVDFKLREVLILHIFHGSQNYLIQL